MRLRNTLLFGAALVLISALEASPAQANDSMAEVAIGGLTLLKTDAISMDSEDLCISRDLLKVKYRFSEVSAAIYRARVALCVEFAVGQKTSDSPARNSTSSSSYLHPFSTSERR